MKDTMYFIAIVVLMVSFTMITNQNIDSDTKTILNQIKTTNDSLLVVIKNQK